MRCGQRRGGRERMGTGTARLGSVLDGRERAPAHHRGDRAGQGQGRRGAAGRCAQQARAHNDLAPADGIVLTRSAEVGQIAVPGSTVLFRLARHGQIEMRGQVAEQDVPMLKIGEQADVRLEGVPHAFTGTIWQIGPIIDPTSRQGTVRIALPSEDQDLRPGAFARADIHVGSSNGIILPQTAVLSGRAGHLRADRRPGQQARAAQSAGGGRALGGPADQPWS
jgi:multidrug efflux pump subunit AcrA (membrane-fusion protein)